MGAGRVRGLRRAAPGRAAAPARDPPSPRRTARSTSTPTAACVHPLLATPPTLSLWRAPTDNDRIGGFAARWAEPGRRPPRASPGSVERDGRDDRRSATRIRAGSTEIAHEATYTRRADGAIDVVETVDIPDALADLARVGTVLEVAPGPEALRWFGAGPHETYPDRKRSGLVGAWESTVADQYVPYIRPQENGGHADVRWLELRDAAGAGLRIDLDEPRQVSVTHHRAADLATATHDVDLVAVPETVIHLDAAHRGLGTASCGPDTTPEYLLGAGRYTWAWTLRDIAAGLIDAHHLVARRARVPPAQRPRQLRHARPRATARSATSTSGRRWPPTGRSRTSSPAASRASRTASANRSRFEYPTTGGGDYRIPGLDRRARRRLDRPLPRLRRASDRRRASPAWADGGLPATYVEADDEADTLVVTVADAVSGLAVDLSYTIFRDRPVVARSARIRNDGGTTVRLTGGDERRRSTCPTPAGSSSS